jgi:hypothetical protein
VNTRPFILSQAIQEGVRKPDALFLAYPATDLTKTPTPSRVLFLNDIVLPYYFLEVCLEAYKSPEHGLSFSFLCWIHFE